MCGAVDQARQQEAGKAHAVIPLLSLSTSREQQTRQGMERKERDSPAGHHADGSVSPAESSAIRDPPNRGQVLVWTSLFVRLAPYTVHDCQNTIRRLVSPRWMRWMRSDIWDGRGNPDGMTWRGFQISCRLLIADADDSCGTSS